MSDKEENRSQDEVEDILDETMDSSEQEMAEETTQAEKQKGGSSLGTVLALLALLGVVALAVAGYFLLGETQSTIRGVQQGLKSAGSDSSKNASAVQALGRQYSAQNQRLDLQDKRFEESGQLLQKEREVYQQGREEMLAAMNALQKRLGRSTSRWMAAEAEYLIRVANHRLQLEGDVETALSALTAADERLRDSGDPLWVPVRNMLAEEIAVLKAVKPVDYNGLSAKLFGLSKQVKKLKVRDSLLTHPQKTEQEKGREKLSLENVLEDGWQGFRTLMTIRRHDQPVAAMLPPEQRFFLGQNLRLQLESARLALLRRDQALFDDALKSAAAWLKEFFDPEEQATRSMLETLGQLSSTKVEPEMPDISASLSLLRDKGDKTKQDQKGKAVEQSSKKEATKKGADSVGDAGEGAVNNDAQPTAEAGEAKAEEVR
jgi:uroporphyrin-III C-methyltransferase